MSNFKNNMKLFMENFAGRYFIYKGDIQYKIEITPHNYFGEPGLLLRVYLSEDRIIEDSYTITFPIEPDKNFGIFIENFMFAVHQLQTKVNEEGTKK